MHNLLRFRFRKVSHFCIQIQLYLDIPESIIDSHGNPTQNAICAHTEIQIGLNRQKRHCTPEHNLQRVEDHVCLQTLPFSKSGWAFGYDLIEDDDEWFGTLEYSLSLNWFLRDRRSGLTMPKAIVFALLRSAPAGALMTSRRMAETPIAPKTRST